LGVPPHRGKNQHHQAERQNQINALHDRNFITLLPHVMNGFCNGCFLAAKE
jgi:hypothetical protein